MNNKLSILVCAHKQDPFTRNEGVYKAVQAGKSLHAELDLGIQPDNEGDNISEKNSSWSEYTVLYWGWKNVKDVEYLGLNHYRRYFDYDFENCNVESLFKKYDIILVKKPKMMSKSYRPIHLMQMTSMEDYYLFMDTLFSLYPQYKQKIIEYFYDSRDSVPYSMFVASKKVYDQYCEFVFPVLFEVEKRLKSHGYTRQKRAIGYFGEYCLGLFVFIFGLKDYRLPLLMNGEHFFKRNCIKSFLWWLYRGVYAFVELGNHKVREIAVPAAVKVGLKQDGIELHSLK